MAAAALLLVAVMSSGMGLFFVVAVFGRATADPQLLHRLLVSLPATAAYAVWYWLVGRASVGELAPVAGPSDATHFAVRGLGYATASMLGIDLLPMSGLLGIAVLAVLCTATLVRLARGAPVGLSAGCLLALFATYVVLGLARAEWEGDQSVRSRYVYVACFFLVLALVDVLSSVDFPERLSAASAAIKGGALIIYALSVSANLEAIQATRAQFQFQADLTRNYLALGSARGDEAWIDNKASFFLLPPVRDIASHVERFNLHVGGRGSSLSVGGRAYEDALVLLSGDRFRVESVRSRNEPMGLHLITAQGRVNVAGNGCVLLSGRRDDAGLTLAVSRNSRVRVASDVAEIGTVGISHDGVVPFRYVGLELRPHAPIAVVVPRIDGDSRRWLLSFRMPHFRGTVEFCAERYRGPGA
jgi:hypothetical protein